MKNLLAATMASAAILMPAAAFANDFPTSARMEYVLECMKNNQGKHEFLYKCSCVVDQIATKVKYDDYVEMSTALRHQSLGGERGAEFRDPKEVRDMARKYRGIQQDANNACFIKQPGS